MFAWNDNYTVGIAEIDEQHKELFLIMNDLFDGLSLKRERKQLEEILDHLLRYGDSHFATEQLFMKKIKYPDTVSHIKEHVLFIRKTKEISLNFDYNTEDVSKDIIIFLKNYFINHLLIADRKFYEYIIGKNYRSQFLSNL